MKTFSVTVEFATLGRTQFYCGEAEDSQDFVNKLRKELVESSTDFKFREIREIES